jgi:hypothetical protein
VLSSTFTRPFGPALSLLRRAKARTKLTPPSVILRRLTRLRYRGGGGHAPSAVAAHAVRRYSRRFAGRVDLVIDLWTAD